MESTPATMLGEGLRAIGLLGSSRILVLLRARASLSFANAIYHGGSEMNPVRKASPLAFRQVGQQRHPVGAALPGRKKRRSWGSSHGPGSGSIAFQKFNERQ